MRSHATASAVDPATLLLDTYPAYAGTRALDELRASDFARMDDGGKVYLDYTGSGVYAESQVRRHMALLAQGVFGNPHSLSPASLAATELVEGTRRVVLDFFRASPAEYVVIFTTNASGALKLVGEAYPFTPGDRYLMAFDNHNSVNGIREFARRGGATVTYVPLVLPDLRLDESRLDDALGEARPGHNLFAYPAQSNFSGVQHSLEWIERAQSRGWDVILDAAAFVPTNRLDLSRWHPDFVPISFYKMFGYPTGVGALLARRDALARLRRPWFAGGTITVASVQGDKHYLAEGEAAFEDGTVNFLGVPAVSLGLELINSIGIETIHRRVECLTGWMLDRLTSLRHRNGRPLIKVFGPVDTTSRGGAVTANFYDAADRLIDHVLVEQKANEAGISVRTGCFCNPGAGETALHLTQDELITCFRQSDTRFTVEDFRHCVDNTKGTGAVRSSLGLVSNAADVDRYVTFVEGFLE